MTLTKRQREIEEANRIRAGLPPRRCPACDNIGAHWTPDTLDEHGDLVRGYFTCQPTPAAPPMPSLLDDIPDVPRSSGWYGGTE